MHESESSKKIRLIYLPFLKIAFACIVGYTFLNWVFIQHHLLSLREDVVKFFLPIALPWIPILLWLRPRTKLLQLEGAKGNKSFIYLMVAAFTIAIPTMVVQHYLQKATDQLTPLQSIQEINKGRATTCYSLKQVYVDKQHLGVHHSFDVSGRGNSDLNMHIYVVMPLLEKVEDTASGSYVAWLGKEYYERISNNLEDVEKEQRYQQFVNETQAAFDASNFGDFRYLEKVGNTEDGDGFAEALKKSGEPNSTAPVLLPVYEPFEQRTGNLLPWIPGSFLIGACLWLVMVLFASLDEEKLAMFEKGETVKAEDDVDLKEVLLPREGYFVTPVLIYLNIGVYLVMVVMGLGIVSFKGPDLITWGANYGPLTKAGEWWRLLSCTFLHGGLMHLAVNMYSLFFVGMLLEPTLGKAKMIGAYVLTGILASATSLWWHEAAISVGASGAIFGLYGLFLVFMLLKVFPAAIASAFLASTLVFIGFNLLMGFTGGIDNAAHIGGLLSGVVVGLLLAPSVKKEEERVAEE